MDMARFGRREPNLVHPGYQGAIQPGAYQPDVYQPGANGRPTPTPLPAPLVGTSSTTGKYHCRVKRPKSHTEYTHGGVPSMLFTPGATTTGCSLSYVESQSSISSVALRAISFGGRKDH
jgi:hypothetical protein